MKKYLINYDLMAPGQKYEQIIGWLRSNGAIQAEYSSWLLEWSASAEALRNRLQALADANDRFLVTEISGEWAWSNSLNADKVRLFLQT